MNVLLFKKDLDTFSDKDIRKIGIMYSLDGPINDLRWLIAIRHANKNQMVRLEDPYIMKKIFKNLDDKDLFRTCNLGAYSDVCMELIKDRYPTLIKNNVRDTIRTINNFKKVQKWLEKYDQDLTIDQIFELKKIHLYNKGVEEIPEGISALVNLEKLVLPNNDIKEIPKGVGKLSNLIELNLDNNPINELPKEIGDLQNLKTLFLDNNNIKGVPSDIGKLSKLELLSLRNTKVKDFPQELYELQNLKGLYIADNNISQKVINDLEKNMPNTEINTTIVADD